MDNGTKREIAEIVTACVHREFIKLRQEIVHACVEILTEFSEDVAKSIAQGNVDHFKKLAQDVYGPQARIYEVRSTDETLRKAAEDSARRRNSELEVSLDDLA